MDSLHTRTHTDTGTGTDIDTDTATDTATDTEMAGVEGSEMEAPYISIYVYI
jgi:hypothetical protein